jgi:hypothetical protein
MKNPWQELHDALEGNGAVTNIIMLVCIFGILAVLLMGVYS